MLGIGLNQIGIGCEKTSGLAAQIRQDLVSYWPLDESGTNDRVDIIGGHDATVVGTDVDSNNGFVLGGLSHPKAAIFSGLTAANTTTYLNVPSHADFRFPGSFTVAGWFQQPDTNNAPTAIDIEGFFRILFRGSNTKIGFRVINTSAGFTLLESDITYVELLWYFVCAWYDADNNQIALAINEEDPVTAAFATPPASDQSTPITIGATLLSSVLASTNCLDGRAQGVGLWGRVLTADERAYLYNSGMGRILGNSNASLSSNSLVLYRDILHRDDKSDNYSSSPNCSNAEHTLLSRTIGGTTYQVMGYYRYTKRVSVSVRSNSGSGWSAWTQYNSSLDALQSNFDGHERIALGIDSDGYLHLCYDTRNDALKYHKTNLPLSSWSGTWSAVSSFTGLNESEACYPCFFLDGDGELHVTYRDGKSGDGDTYIKSYNTSTTTWSGANGCGTDGLFFNGKGTSPTCNAYLLGCPKPDANGLVHIVYYIRRTSDAATAQDVHHVRWNPDTGAFTSMDGTSITVPRPALSQSGVNDSRVLAVPEGTNYGVLVQGHAIDTNDNPHICFWAEDDDDYFQLHHLYYDGSTWNDLQITERTTTGADKFATPRILIDSNDRVHFLYVDSDTYPDTRHRWVYADSSDYTSRTTQVFENFATPTLDEGGATASRVYYDEQQWQGGNFHAMVIPLNSGGGDGLLVFTEIDNFSL